MDPSAGVNRWVLGPASHHTSKARDPRIQGVNPGGDGAEPPESRERVWIIPVAMVLVIAGAVAAGMWIFSGGANDATDSLAERGLAIDEAYTDAVTVSFRDDGRFSIYVAEDADLGTEATDYALRPITAMPEADDWAAYDWTGAEAATNDEEFSLALDTGTSTWNITNLTVPLSGTADPAALDNGWAQLEEILEPAQQ
ncbi:hypothetical protein [Demequina silvatica]|uniref:hypothetical protein n=1 Tax=Demequina silvatica TaxID=1638988 RepID=UPI00078599CA|nr:hypothetical protein [Demequina silvatica]